MRAIFLGLGLLAALPALLAAAEPQQGFVFDSIDGGVLALDEWRGQPVLVVNTASRCGFAPQYDGMQEIYDRYRDRGLVVLAVPSNDFRQELGSEAAVKEYCELNFDLDLPMTTITPVTGAGAHPFYLWLQDEAEFAPSWNFNKVLIGPEGEFVAAWGSTTRPTSAPIRRAIEPLLD
ncbi:MAG TPA: glutathione peroxidase [Citreicella sp.]|jgi:glutathione peroxidase|uniref:Glutathione peroxidase n=1 Tax=Salipiger marinus TaxID=555512 RepID=A0A1G8JJQ6_9RHOB|nr:glutathione peroxidase [Salipiger marinus]SDI31321.1 glutathione peroxidase [Salipiger marinus]HBM58456.1 glutathione peroxidase [Citreicella sp.]HBT02818.1 glutathione peroxidase [Citreicella sp.]|tara:strand:- start:499 stop:1029 length:531 start_codon:yes stop_codon:yes gene_type:complete